MTPLSAFGSELQPFAGIASFMRAPVTRDLRGADAAIVGVPYDGGTSYRSGTRFGPRRIREASLLLWGYHWNLEFENLHSFAFRLLDLRRRLLRLGRV